MLQRAISALRGHRSRDNLRDRLSVMETIFFACGAAIDCRSGAVGQQPEEKMKTSDYVELLRPLTETGSLYATAQLLGVTEPAMHRYAKGQRHFDEYACLRVAELLNMPAEKVIADIAMEREKDPERRVYWAELLKKYGVAATVLIGIAVVYTATSPTEPVSQFAWLMGLTVNKSINYTLYGVAILVAWAVTVRGIAASRSAACPLRGSLHSPEN